MSESISLIKENPLLPAEDYDALRKEGFKAIEKLGSGIWTDYNNSDPGITILEAICYAITDLAYRTGFEIKDLLTPEHLTEETWKNIFYTARQILHNNPLTISDYRKLIIDIIGVRNAWIEPSKDYEVPVWVDYNFIERRKDTDCGCTSQELKTCFGKLGLQPVTKPQVDERNSKRILQLNAAITENANAIALLDPAIVKLTAEIAALENDDLARLALQARLDKLIEQKSKLTASTKEYQTEKTIIGNLQFTQSKILEIEGLYNVMVEYEEDILEEDKREEVRQLVVERLAAHRNLCEDFLSVNAVEYIDFGIGASIVLEEYADPDEVLSEIFFVIYKYFTPSVAFHTIPQMMEKGLQIDEIFEGPALHHGFIDTDELEKTDLFRDLRLSDIISEIADIKGLKAITYLHLPFKGFDDKTSDKFYFNQWVDSLKQQRKIARIQPAMSAALFCKEHDFITYNAGRTDDRAPARMLKMFHDKKKQERTYKLHGYANDYPVPAGEYMDLQDYFPVTNSLPLCYGVNPRGLPGDADQKRIVQSLQLKGYLLFFEQLLSGYLVQLDHLRNLFSFDYEDQTYFTRALTEINDLSSLLIDHAHQGEVIKAFASVLHNLVEPPAVFHDRRNKFLSHMLGRFGENLDEYETITQWLDDGNAGERIINDKIRILKDGAYFQISSNRGKGYNYTTQEIWDTPNVSGAEARIGRLLGFGNINRRTLSPDFIVSQPVMIMDEKTKTLVLKKNKKGQPLNILKIYLPATREKLLLTSVEVIDGCCTEDLAGEIIAHADNRIYYKFHEELKPRSRKAAGALGAFWFELWDGTNMETAVLLATSERFDKREEREEAFKELLKAIKYINENEGLHLIEHLLLRPKMDQVYDEIDNPIPVTFLDICLDTCDLGKGLNEGVEIPGYQKKLHRLAAEKCYDNMPWILEYFRLNPKTNLYDQSLLYQETFATDKEAVPLKFRYYSDLAKRVKDIQEFGSERINYRIVSNAEEQPVKIKYSFIIAGKDGMPLAQSPYVFNKKTKIQERDGIAIPEDIDIEIDNLVRYFEFQLDMYCEPDPCDNNEDPFSFRTTLVLPCWPKRMRNKTFQHLVEKTIEAETPAHIHTRVVWLGIWQMKKFEEVYCAWLQEMAQTEIPGYQFVNPFIETINTLQPCGTCQDECSPPENKIQ
jgi:hypothetical protein